MNMNIIDTNEFIDLVKAADDRIKRLDIRGFAVIKRDGAGRPYLSTREWFDIHGENDGLIDRDITDADEVAEFIDMDTSMYYAWCEGDGDHPTLASFGSANDRDTWSNQR